MKLLILVLLALAPALVEGQDEDDLRIGVRESSPFVIAPENGRFSGTAVEISGFTTAFTTALALGSLETAIQRPRDLEGVEPSNRALLEVTGGPSWDQLLNRYFGEGPK